MRLICLRSYKNSPYFIISSFLVLALITSKLRSTILFSKIFSKKLKIQRICETQLFDKKLQKKARYISTLQNLKYLTVICHPLKFYLLYFGTNLFLLQYPQFSYRYWLMLLQLRLFRFALTVYRHFSLSL